MTEEKFHFVGICGTAMGSVAAAMKDRGYQVTGSDQAMYDPMKSFLERKGVALSEGYAAENIPDDATTVIIGNAISRGNVEAEAVLNRRLLYRSLAETLKEYFLRGKNNFVVSGTHGKTTTASMLAWLFESAGRSPDYMIGGIPKNFSQGARFEGSEVVVLEGDEYDTAFFDKRSKFLHYLPQTLVINNIEFDHADIYASIDPIKLTFERLINIMPSEGCAFINGDEQNCLDVAQGAQCRVETVGLGESCEKQITDIVYEPDGSAFTVGGERYFVPMVGEFNVRNAAMATLAASNGGLTVAEIQKGLASFGGITRRQEERGTVREVTVVDDFAHHPTAIGLSVQAMRQRYPDRKIWVLFEPRSNTTRQNIFQKELAENLSQADEVILPEVPNPSKFKEEDRLDPEKLIADISATGTAASFVASTNEIVAKVASEAQAGDIIAVLSNGGFDGIHEKILRALEK